jgi:predicted phage terminase large subunit-like protein
MEIEDLPPGADEANLFGYDSLGAYIAIQWPRFECEPHHARLIRELEAVERGECLRLIVTFPPRHGKSLICSEHFPAWYLGRNPQKYIIAATYAQELADDFGRKTRNQMKDPIYPRVFPGITLSKDSQAAKRLNTPQGGAYFALGRNGSMTGRGAHVLLLDDMFKGREEADSETIRKKVKAIYAEAAYTRLMKDGAIVLIGTRWHDDDLIGWVLKEHKHENWRVVNFPAIRFEGEDEDGNPRALALWPNHFPLKRLMAIKKTIGERAWNALYMQKPFTEEGAIIKRKHWQPWLEDVPRADFIVISLDTAYTEEDENDASACTVWYVVGDEADLRQKVLLRYAWAKKLEFPELVTEIRETWNYFGQAGVPVRVLIEAKASGLSVIQELRRRVTDMSIWAISPKGDKVARAHSVTPVFEAEKVYAMAQQSRVPALPGELDLDGVQMESKLETAFRPWAEEVIGQCVAFPRADAKDLVDSTTQALRHIRDMGTQLMPEDDPHQPITDARARRKDGAKHYGPIGAKR